MISNNFPWSCPFCGRDTTITRHDRDSGNVIFDMHGERGLLSITYLHIVCPNPTCRQSAISVFLHSDELGVSDMRAKGKVMKTWSLVPQSDAKALPDYVPVAIRQDYEEACAVRELSPKASATLARRALQGMIRDYWKVTVKSGKLYHEIEAIKDRVESETWLAIDAVRSIGNIGAHMEQDVNLIVDVEPDEAKRLTWLIELLVKDWYINRHERKLNLKKIVGTAQVKKVQKKSAPTP